MFQIIFELLKQSAAPDSMSRMSASVVDGYEFLRQLFHRKVISNAYPI